MEHKITRDVLSRFDISEPLAQLLAKKLASIFEESEDALDCWVDLVNEILTPELPFELHQYLYEYLAEKWPGNHGPMPVWLPSVPRQQASNLANLMNKHGFESLEVFQRWSVDERARYWEVMIAELGIVCDQPFEEVVDLSDGPSAPRWLVGARLNIADSCFLTDPEAVAVVYREEHESTLSSMTYGELDVRSNRVANGLVGAGFAPGEGIAIDMVMNVDAVAIYLGVVKAGCRVISIADSFSPEEIAVRLRIGEARAIFTMDHILRGGKRLPMYEKVLAAGSPRAIVLPAEEELAIDLREGDLAWSDFLSDKEHFVSRKAEPHDIINILFSSGTTGEPKAIPWDHTTPIKCAADGFLHQDIQVDTVACWPTNLGWMMGPWLIFATLINRGTIALFHGAPNTRAFCRFVQDAEVAMLGVVPSLVKFWRQSGALEEVNWTAIQSFSSTGECSSPTDMHYLMSRARYVPVIEYIGGTEIGGGYAAGTVVQPAIPSTFTTPAFGLDLVLLDEKDQPADEGELYLVPPSIGLSTSLLNKNHHEIYFKDVPAVPDGRVLRRHGDQFERLSNGYLRALGRADDTMNLGGIKTSSAEIERVLKELEEIDETAAIAVSPDDGGPSQLVIYAVLENPSDEDRLMGEMQRALKLHLNPLFKIADVRFVEALPRTASGKVMRRVLRKRYESEPGDRPPQPD